MGSSKEQMNWLGGAGRGRGQGKRAGQMSQSHMPFISHCAWKKQRARDARKMCYDLKSDAPTLTNCNICCVLSQFPLMFCYQYLFSLPSLGKLLYFRKL